MKLSKQQIKEHEYCLEYLKQDELTYEEKVFVYDHYIPAYSNNIGQIGAFFTPKGMARDLNVEICGSSVIDLCAGIGRLSFEYYHANRANTPEICCIERNPEFCEVGEKLLPEALWINDDVLDERLFVSLPEFHFAISNPPFGNIKSDTDSSWLKYKGNEFEYKVIEIGTRLAKRGAYIIPQMSAPFKYSGENNMSFQMSRKLQSFVDDTGINLEMNCGIDLSQYRNDWIGTNMLCEIVLHESGF